MLLKYNLINEKKETNSSHIINGIQKDSTPAEIFFYKVQFTTSKQFNNLKQYLEEVIQKVDELKDKLNDQEHSNRLEKILDIPVYKLGLRYDLKGLKRLS